MKVLAYKILTHNKRDELTKEVERHLREGWQPWGSLQMTETPGESQFYAQAMVIYSDDE
jgi:hypothetical protein